jgi:16S rRNA G966 N2-methylase RsmD
MGPLLQALEIICEVQRKRSNKKNNKKINKRSNLQNMFFLLFLDPPYFQAS